MGEAILAQLRTALPDDSLRLPVELLNPLGEENTKTRIGFVPIGLHHPLTLTIGSVQLGDDLRGEIGNSGPHIPSHQLREVFTGLQPREVLRLMELVLESLKGGSDVPGFSTGSNSLCRGSNRRNQPGTFHAGEGTHRNRDDTISIQISL